MSNGSDERNVNDVAPGFLEYPERSAWEGIRSYLIGLVLAAFLTVLSFYLVGTNLIWEPGLPAALASLALAQIGVHLVFFLHITSAPDNTNTVLALAFGVFIVGLIIGGSLWIMFHLNQNMVPASEMMAMPY
jgi:cytochrome o ubiquinol oxidase operon protein cyoD